MCETSDIELMARIKTGDEIAFAELIRRHQSALLNFFRRLGAQQDREDLVQETFLRLYRYRMRYKPTAKFTTFLYTLARHAWTDRWRKGQRRERLREALTICAPTMTDGGMGQVYDRMDTEQLLARLPDKLREVVVLSLYHHMRYEEIGEILDIPVGTVKSRVFNALQRLKEIRHE